MTDQSAAVVARAGKEDFVNHRTRSSRRLPALSALAAMAIIAPLAAACGSASGGTGSGAQTSVALATRDFSNPYWAALRDGTVAGGKKLGIHTDVEAGSNETDATGENQVIQSQASQNFSCYAAVPVNATNVITPLLQVQAKGKPIINVDTAIDPTAARNAGLKITSFIGSDNTQAGTIAGNYMLQLLHGHGKVAILEGIPGEKNGIARVNAFRQVTAGKLQVVQAQTANYEESEGLQVTQDILKVHPDISGIFAADDEMALGAAQAISDAGLTGKIKIVSIDGITQALQEVAAGKLTATISQYPYVEGEMVDEACAALADHKQIPQRIVSPIHLITQSTAKQAIADFPRPFFSFHDPLASLAGDH
jgi:ribose transport system substrate-binding protein